MLKQWLVCMVRLILNSFMVDMPTVAGKLFKGTPRQVSLYDKFVEDDRSSGVTTNHVDTSTTTDKAKRSKDNDQRSAF